MHCRPKYLAAWQYLGRTLPAPHHAEYPGTSVCRQAGQLSLSCPAGKRKDPERESGDSILPVVRFLHKVPSTRTRQLPSYFPIGSLRFDRSSTCTSWEGVGDPERRKRKREKKKKEKRRASVVGKARTRRTEPAGYLGGLPDRWPAAGSLLANRCGRSYRQGTQSPVPSPQSQPSPAQSCGPRGLQRLQKPGEGQ